MRALPQPQLVERESTSDQVIRLMHGNAFGSNGDRVGLLRENPFTVRSL